MAIPVFGAPGPAQSDELIHFVHRGPKAGYSPDVPAEIQVMGPQERLDAILSSARQKGFAPFHRAPANSMEPPLAPCVCYSEAPATHLEHLIADRLFKPWGIAITRKQMLDAGGGSIAYVGDDVYEKFYRMGLGAWAVRTGDGSQWMHEREWRLPMKKGSNGLVRLTSLAAILIGKADWRPSKVGTGQWVNGSTGEPCQPGEDPFAIEVKDYPELWLKTPIWVWDWATRAVIKYDPGTLV